jgi:hypothetical protein
MRTQVFDFTELTPEETKMALIALLNHLGLNLFMVIDDEFPVGHPDQVRFEVEKE